MIAAFLARLRRAFRSDPFRFKPDCLFCGQPATLVAHTKTQASHSEELGIDMTLAGRPFWSCDTCRPEGGEWKPIETERKP